MCRSPTPISPKPNAASTTIRRLRSGRASNKSSSGTWAKVSRLPYNQQTLGADLAGRVIAVGNACGERDACVSAGINVIGAVDNRTEYRTRAQPGFLEGYES